jgi:galactose mutarotase-like enzyme
MIHSDDGSAGVAAITLQSDDLAVVIIPSEGGRIASIRSQSGVEFLTQSRPDRSPIKPGLERLFQNGPCAGAEECLPTVGPCNDCSGGPAPDHGDFWQLHWRVDFFNGQQLAMHAVGFSRPLRLERTLRVDGSSLFLGYKVINVGSKALSFLYAWHPLFAVEPGDRIVLPAEVGEVTLSYSRDETIEYPGKDLIWPTLRDGKGIRDLSVALAPGSRTAEMIYTRRLRVGRCGLFRRAPQQGIIVSFDPVQLPFLGVWLCFGGWPLTGSEPKQVAIALEPTTAPCNTLAAAEATELAVKLDPAGSFDWDLQVGLTSPAATYEAFCESVQQP